MCKPILLLTIHLAQMHSFVCVPELFNGLPLLSSCGYMLSYVDLYSAVLLV